MSLTRIERTACLVPARMQSTRFEGKPLVQILAKPMIIRVLERCACALGKSNTFACTEDKNIFDLVTQYGYRAVLTSRENPTGTDRMAEAINDRELRRFEYFINVQGDEPLVHPEDIRACARAKLQNPDAVINMYHEIPYSSDLLSSIHPKVVINREGFLVYMSRSLIPGNKSGFLDSYKLQCCIYGYSREELEVFKKSNGKTQIEAIEDIEILRFLELGLTVKMIKAQQLTIPVDYPEDVLKVEQYLLKYGEFIGV